MVLTDIGWLPCFQEAMDALDSDGLFPGRVAREDRTVYLVWTANGEIEAEVSGGFRHAARARAEHPTVGDWLALSPIAGEERATIRAVLTRRTRLVRRAPGPRTEEQVLAANIDAIFIVAGLDREYNPRRIERYLLVAAESGAEAVVVLNKADLRDDAEACVREVQKLDAKVPVLTLSALEGRGVEALEPWLGVGRTAVFVGSSGVGKSTLINAMIGEERQLVGEVREQDNRGRHTTTWREMILLPDGGVVIDTPGIREIQIWLERDESDGFEGAFGDIATLAKGCRFRDCRHENEPGCAVLEALSSGELDEGLHRDFLRLRGEAQSMARRREEAARRADDRTHGRMMAKMSALVQKRKNR